MQLCHDLDGKRMDIVNQILYVKREEFGKYIERLADKRDGNIFKIN